MTSNEAYVSIYGEEPHHLEGMLDYHEKRFVFGRGWEAAQQQALASTPAQSLQAHYDELLEQCAKLCENQWDVDSAAASIRNLKGKL